MFSITTVNPRIMYQQIYRKGSGALKLSMLSLVLISLSTTTTYAENLADSSSAQILSFNKAVNLSQKNDPWLTGNVHKQQSLEAMSLSANTLPDPKVSLALANVPVDGFAFDQENMTQFKLGVSQMFPRGESLSLKQKQLRIQSEAYPFLRQDRSGKVAVMVGSLWLDAYRVQQSIALIEKNRSLFEQLADVAEASYSSAVGKTRQQDIVRAQLELTRLEDRLDRLAQQQNRFEGQLSQWLSDYQGGNEQQNELSAIVSLHNMELSKNLPQIELHNSQLVFQEKWQKAEQLIPYFAKHPAVLAIDKKIAATKTGVNLAEQKYQPEWGVNASYGYRADNQAGQSRADFASIGVVFDLPLFTENRQDQDVKSAISNTEAIKTDRILLLRQFLGAYSSAKGRLLRLIDRKSLYQNKLLPQIHDQAEASLTAYTNDDGDFSEVVRARIAVLNAEIDELVINVEQQKIILELNYLFIGELGLNQSTTMQSSFTQASTNSKGQRHDY